jgi:putative DNA methylase
VALSTLSDLVAEARLQAIEDGGAPGYADAIATYLAFSVDKCADFWSTLATWSAQPKNELVVSTFRRHALAMTWDFGEANPFSESGGNFIGNLESAARCLDISPATATGCVRQLDACGTAEAISACYSTDPPYYDNIGYADLSDFFYVWLRRSLSPVHPELFSTLLVPKKQELVATPFRFNGSRQDAQAFFEDGFGRAFAKMRRTQDPNSPLTVFYAFKQSDTDEDDDGGGAVSSTGWETMLEGLIRADFQVTATWPMRSERVGRSISLGANALASSIVLACRPRPESAPITTRKDFLASLKKELSQALRNLQKGNIAPVDLAQAAIGPGMAVFSRYKKVLETDGSPMRVRTALALINQGLDEVFSELESEFDPDTRWALAWFEQHQFDEGLYGEAEVLATAKALSIAHLAEAGLLHSRAGKVRLLRRDELLEDWDPSAIGRLTVWEVTQHLIRCLDQKGEKETANLKAKIGGMAEIARDLAYRLYTLCERKGWAEEAGYYNSLVVAWPSMASEAFELK